MQTEQDAILARLSNDAFEIVQSTPLPGNRQLRMLDVANLMAKDGFTNHQIIVLMEMLADRWDVLPKTNLYGRNSAILAMVKNARRHYPGTGKHVAARRGWPQQKGQPRAEPPQRPAWPSL